MVTAALEHSRSLILAVRQCDGSGYMPVAREAIAFIGLSRFKAGE
jgi:hypothetical protein